MARVRSHPLPAHALLNDYTRRGAYTDCFVTEVAQPVTHAEFVEAFYCTPLFRLERWILAWLVSKPSTDAQARQLARAERRDFAAWSVEARADDQLLMRDYRGQTCSWLMVAVERHHDVDVTRLYFGSAVVPIAHLSYRLLLGFHKLYSRALLSSARRALQDRLFTSRKDRRA